MKRSAKSSRKCPAKRNLFAELKEGMKALADSRAGKQPVRTHSIELKVVSTVTPKI